MVAFRHLGGWVLCGCAGWMCAVACAQKPAVRAWDDAVAARQQFEAEPAGTHTKAEYARVMDGFRAIYHGNPVDVHAARAVEQVAELLAEQGHEFGDAKSLKNAAGQYDFLRAQYPGSSAARAAGAKAEELRAELEHPVAPVRAETAPAVRTAEAARGVPAGNADSSAALRNDKKSEPRNSQESALRNEKEGASRNGEESAPRDGRESGLRNADVMPQSGEHYRPPVHEPVHEVVASEGAAPVAADAAKKMAMVTAIRHWSTPTYTRVAIDLGDEVTYQAARVEHPDRIYFDLHHARLAQALSGKSFAVTDDGFLTRIRAAQFSNDVTRVVLDVHEVSEYTAFLLPNPYRLIIDIHGKGAGEESKPAPNETAVADAPPVQPAPSTAGPQVSSLPPMAVTDGSASFGLPAKKAESAAKREDAAVAQPRVVIPSKPTAQKPVPNTVVSRSADTGMEVAEVSSQPGRVVATSRPTSAPIAERSRDTRGEIRDTKVKASAHVMGEPAEVAPPTADGKTSMMRALGLKIGRIVIDAGHGGHDSGTLGADGIEEKDVALDVALRLGKLLHDRLGAEIVYTRADDTFIPLETRTAIANKAQADLFISVHCNSSQDASARGVEVYYLNFTSDPDAMRVAARENAVSNQNVHELSDLVKKIALKDKIDESKELASDVDESLYAGLARGNAGLKNRGVKKAPFVVLIGANMPSVLAEISFVTNPTDAAELRTPEYRERVAESLFKGVARYAGGINGVKPPKVGTTQRASLRGAGAEKD